MTSKLELFWAGSLNQDPGQNHWTYQSEEEAPPLWCPVWSLGRCWKTSLLNQVSRQAVVRTQTFISHLLSVRCHFRMCSSKVGEEIKRKMTQDPGKVIRRLPKIRCSNFLAQSSCCLPPLPSSFLLPPPLLPWGSKRPDTTCTHTLFTPRSIGLCFSFWKPSWWISGKWNSSPHLDFLSTKLFLDVCYFNVTVSLLHTEHWPAPHLA